MSVLFAEVRADLRAHARESGGAGLTRAGFWVAATYRLGRAAHRVRSRPLRLGILSVHRILSVPVRGLLSVHIPHNADIGPGLCMPHPRNIILPPDARFGSDALIHHEVTVGRGPVAGVPRVGDRVTVWPGARLLGGVEIGDDVEIGANAVVTRPVPTGASASAPPCRVIPAETADRLAAMGRRAATSGGA